MSQFRYRHESELIVRAMTLRDSHRNGNAIILLALLDDCNEVANQVQIVALSAKKTKVMSQQDEYFHANCRAMHRANLQTEFLRSRQMHFCLPSCVDKQRREWSESAKRKMTKKKTDINLREVYSLVSLNSLKFFNVLTRYKQAHQSKLKHYSLCAVNASDYISKCAWCVSFLFFRCNGNAGRFH